MAPKYVNGNIWSSKADVIGVTTNSYVATDGKLVMGRGAALQLAQRIERIQFMAGRVIKNTCGHLGKYGWFVLNGGGWGQHFDRPYGFFQVKYHFKDYADLGLIDYSVGMLNEWLRNKRETVAINFPGIGNGRQSIEKIFPLVEKLSDRVTVYYIERAHAPILDALIAEAETAVPF